MDLIQDSLKFVGDFEAQAHGHPKGVLVKMQCYQGNYQGELKPDSEIEEIVWLKYKDIESNEKILQLLLRLKSTNKIIIIASHIIESLTRICDRINLLEGGVIKTTYEKSDFSILENELKDKVKLKIDEALDGLI